MRIALPSRAARWIVPLVALGIVGVFGTRSALGGGPVDDGVPTGTVAFFGSGASCPMGWIPAPNAGRMIVGVTDPMAVGRTVNTPLADREDRTHTHGFSGSITLATRSIAGANGGNQQGARAGMHPVTGTTLGSTSGLPFIQLRACVKQ
jgi:hypothetical protein